MTREVTIKGPKIPISVPPSLPAQILISQAQQVNIESDLTDLVPFSTKLPRKIDDDLNDIDGECYKINRKIKKYHIATAFMNYALAAYREGKIEIKPF